MAPKPPPNAQSERTPRTPRAPTPGFPRSDPPPLHRQTTTERTPRDPHKTPERTHRRPSTLPAATSPGHKLLIQPTAAEDMTVRSRQTLQAWRRIAYIAVGTRTVLASNLASDRCRPGVGQMPPRDDRVAVAAAGGVLYAAPQPRWRRVARQLRRLGGFDATGTVEVW